MGQGYRMLGFVVIVIVYAGDRAHGRGAFWSVCGFRLARLEQSRPHMHDT